MFAISNQRISFTDLFFIFRRKPRNKEKDETDRTVEGSGRQRGIDRNETVRMVVER